MGLPGDGTVAGEGPFRQTVLITDQVVNLVVCGTGKQRVSGPEVAGLPAVLLNPLTAVVVFSLLGVPRPSWVQRVAPSERGSELKKRAVTPSHLQNMDIIDRYHELP